MVPPRTSNPTTGLKDATVDVLAAKCHRRPLLSRKQTRRAESEATSTESSSHSGPKPVSCARSSISSSRPRDQPSSFAFAHSIRGVAPRVETAARTSRESSPHPRRQVTTHGRPTRDPATIPLSTGSPEGTKRKGKGISERCKSEGNSFRGRPTPSGQWGRTRQERPETGVHATPRGETDADSFYESPISFSEVGSDDLRDESKLSRRSCSRRRAEWTTCCAATFQHLRTFSEVGEHLWGHLLALPSLGALARALEDQKRQGTQPPTGSLAVVAAV